MSEIQLHSAANVDIHDQMEFARSVVVRPEGAARSLLPEAYRDNPANVLIAVGLGSSMGLGFAESLYRIDVIQGKPTAAAELIASNVRKAGHKLRVRLTEEPPSCTATIVRADDLDFPFEVTRDMAWAQKMGLAGKDNYKKQPATMLQWRAISAVARLACPEALYGVQYTPDELADFPERPGAAAQTGGLAAALQSSGGEAAPEAGTSVSEPTSSSPPESDPPLTDKTRKALFALMGECGITTDDDQRAFLSDTLGREVASRKTLTEEEGVRAGRRLRAIQQGDPLAEWTPTFDADEVPDA